MGLLCSLFPHGLSLSAYARELIYPRGLPPGTRTEARLPKPESFGVTDYDSLRLPTPDGQSLHGLFIRAGNPTARNKLTVLMFHGNAGAIHHRVPIARFLDQVLGCHVLMLEYRGYGLSSGNPDEQGLRIDAQVGLDWLAQQPATRDGAILVYGQSLGGAVAIRLVADNLGKACIKGLVLENTFLSIRKMIPSFFPPARYIASFCHQHWDSETTLPLIRDVPILFLAGSKDEIVPPAHMRELYAVCRAETKVFKEFANGTHNETVMEENYFAHLADFVSQYVL